MNEPIAVGPDEPGDGARYPQAGRTRLIAPSAISQLGTGHDVPPPQLLAALDDESVFMMGDNPRLARMPAEPTLFDVFRLRVNDFDPEFAVGGGAWETSRAGDRQIG